MINLDCLIKNIQWGQSTFDIWLSISISIGDGNLNSNLANANRIVFQLGRTNIDMMCDPSFLIALMRSDWNVVL